MNIFSFSNSVKAASQMEPCTPEMMNAVFDDPQSAAAQRLAASAIDL